MTSTSSACGSPQKFANQSLMRAPATSVRRKRWCPPMMPEIRMSTPVCSVATSGYSASPSTSASTSEICRQLRAVESRNASGVSIRIAAANSCGRLAARPYPTVVATRQTEEEVRSRARA